MKRIPIFSTLLHSPRASGETTASSIAKVKEAIFQPIGRAFMHSLHIAGHVLLLALMLMFVWQCARNERQC